MNIIVIYKSNIGIYLLSKTQLSVIEEKGKRTSD